MQVSFIIQNKIITEITTELDVLIKLFMEKENDEMKSGKCRKTQVSAFSVRPNYTIQLQSGHRSSSVSLRD